ncbi:MAG: RNA polymerase sigma factor [Lachnospiraceae bacterium]
MLPEQQKTIIVLKYYKEFTIKEIVSILNENENTVKTRLYSALKK